MIVVDASAVTEFLTSSGMLARRVRERIATEDEIHAPYLIDTEVASSVIGMGTRGGKPKLSKGEVDRYLKEFADLPLTRHPALPLTARVRTLAANLSVYDATYVALAEVLDLTLVTTDSRIRRGIGRIAKCDIVDFNA
ncbi:type II toxin-antitoxin system VapC family toxin [Streptomyces sp. DG2A-72]|uniref:type II toxin-antitoxin system VapC family toxin n=1 Tax=Streptomyces sp. DG2A-72 TaxID=3051386 RepID=UPI00265B8D0F|nr:type II toxin-antitoxin system VapC family toxin [Streptomyces sp. DG2A-72]MDO0932707.1 type II toxin-antitoxin system VapC family toxin [Streptomyces sp. DG2A-72]